MAEEQSVLNQVLEKQQTVKTEPEEKTEEAATEDEQVSEKPAEGPKKEEVKEEPKKEEPKKQEEQRPRKRAEANVVLVGKKPTMSYVLAAVTQFSDGMDEIHIKARGRSISRAVDVAEVVKNRFVQGVKINVLIGTDEIIDENNNKINVSTIDIVMNK